MTVKELRELLDNPAIKDDACISIDYTMEYSEDTIAIEPRDCNGEITGSGGIHFSWKE